MPDLYLNTTSPESYRHFLAIKKLPKWSINGRVATYPEEYRHLVEGNVPSSAASTEYEPHPAAFDFQRDIVRLALAKRKFAIFADCGLGKTLMLLEYARHVNATYGGKRCILIVSPLNVVSQTIQEAEKFYGEALPIASLRRSTLGEWLATGSGIGITNYEALGGHLSAARLGALILDESSILKSHYGKWGAECMRLGKGLEWKLCCTGTPAPNDRIEFANHAVFLDAFPTINSFLAKFFVNRGQTSERWVLKPHALEPFYRTVSHWAIFLANPTTYGWHDVDTSTIPPIKIHYHHIRLTDEQTHAACDDTGMLFPATVGGIVSRQKMATIAKGFCGKEKVESLKPETIKRLVAQWPDESTIVWCLYNTEQSLLEAVLPDAISLKGSTSMEDRMACIADFKAGRRKVLISKPKILGFGLNLQVCTRQVFSGLQDSYESYYQAVKRSNRIGSTKPLNVHIPFTDLEEPLIANVMRKAANVQRDTEEQERIFRKCLSH